MPLNAPEGSLLPDIEAVLSSHAGRHPGIIAEAVVARLTNSYALLPRETHHRERRKDHAERIRRFTHEVYRILEVAGGPDPAREIAARMAKAFVASPRDAGRAGNGSGAAA